MLSVRLPETFRLLLYSQSGLQVLQFILQSGIFSAVKVKM